MDLLVCATWTDVRRGTRELRSERADKGKRREVRVPHQWKSPSLRNLRQSELATTILQPNALLFGFWDAYDSTFTSSSDSNSSNSSYSSNSADLESVRVRSQTHRFW